MTMYIPSPEDLAAARLLLGEEFDAEDKPLSPNAPNVLSEFLVPGSGLLGWRVQHRVDTKHGGGTYLYCPCPAWKFGARQACKHTDYVVDMGLV